MDTLWLDNTQYQVDIDNFSDTIPSSKLVESYTVLLISYYNLIFDSVLFNKQPKYKNEHIILVILVPNFAYSILNLFSLRIGVIIIIPLLQKIAYLFCIFVRITHLLQNIFKQYQYEFPFSVICKVLQSYVTRVSIKKIKHLYVFNIFL